MLMTHSYFTPTLAAGKLMVMFVSFSPVLKTTGSITKMPFSLAVTLTGTVISSSVFFLRRRKETVVFSCGASSTVVEVVWDGKYTP